MTIMKRVLSGIQPTGRLHLGNLIGAVENWVKLQDSYECFFFIADFHALTTAYAETKNLKEDIRQVAIDLLSAGIAPEKCVLFKQSDVPELPLAGPRFEQPERRLLFPLMPHAKTRG